MSNFLPRNYEAPKFGRYTKLQQGENKIRILSQPILGWEDWTADKKPVRTRYDGPTKIPRAINESKPPKHFWAVIVWNYSSSQIEVFQFAQAGIRDAIAGLCVDKDWGEPFFYDIKITKSGQDQQTKYQVVALPHKPVSAEVRRAFEESPCSLEALFRNGNPFEPTGDVTPGIFEELDLKGKSATVSAPSLGVIEDYLWEKDIDHSRIEEWLKVQADKKGVTREKMIESCVLRMDLFEKAYTKWLDSVAPAFKEDEAIPF